LEHCRCAAAAELKEVTVDPSTTALLLLDIMKGTAARARAASAAVPNIKRLHDQARAHNMVVWYSIVGSEARRRPRTSWTPRSNRGPANGIASPGPDKFLGSTLQPTAQASRHQNCDHLRQLVPGGDRWHRFGRGAAWLPGDPSGRVARRARTSIASIRDVPSRQRAPGYCYEQGDDDPEHDDQILAGGVCRR